MPMLGGIVADKWNFRKTVTLGIVVMFLGYLLMAVPTARMETSSMIIMFAALLLISIGTGLFKGNLQVMVGDLYNNPRYADKRDVAFSLFYMAINIGAMFAPSMTQWLCNNALQAKGFVYDPALPSICTKIVSGETPTAEAAETVNQYIASHCPQFSGNIAGFADSFIDAISTGYSYAFAVALNQRQIDYYIKAYLGILRLDCISVIVDADDNLVALGICMPSLSAALRKAKGKLFPTGWYHLLQGIHGKNDVVDLLLIAVKKEYMNKGVNALIFADLIPIFNKEGFKEAESNLELEGNDSVRMQWQYFPHRQHRRRRAFSKNL